VMSLELGRNVHREIRATNGSTRQEIERSNVGEQSSGDESSIRQSAWGQPFHTAQEELFGDQGDPFCLTFGTQRNRIIGGGLDGR
jgi:hypothetical protein